MPIYEYRCRKCGKLFEKIQKVNEGGESLKCPYCDGQKPEKVLSSFSSSKGSDDRLLAVPRVVRRDLREANGPPVVHR